MIRLALLKASYVAIRRKDAVVVGADTIVSLGPRRFGKPDSRDSAREMLKQLSGKTHLVITGVALVGIEPGIRETLVEKTAVRFRSLSDEEVEGYILTQEPYDKAGGYGIQGKAGSFIEETDGEIENVIGLPMISLENLLKKAGFNFLRPSAHPPRGSKVPAD